jgi:hypothetical protein
MPSDGVFSAPKIPSSHKRLLLGVSNFEARKVFFFVLCRRKRVGHAARLSVVLLILLLPVVGASCADFHKNFSLFFRVSLAKILVSLRI